MAFTAAFTTFLSAGTSLSGTAFSLLNIPPLWDRAKPIIVNAYTGVARAYCTAPVEASYRARMKMSVPGLLNMHILLQALGVYIIQIDKTKPGQGIAAGLAASASSALAKVTIVVDKDVNIYRLDEIMAAFGSRWQPVPGTVLIPQTEGVPLDPSATVRGMNSNIVIDATRQLPAEGGPDLLVMELATGGERTIDGIADGGRILLGHPKTREAMRAGLAMYFVTLEDEALMEVANRIVRELEIEHFFNIQLVGDHVIEINPRIAYQFADLYHKVDGFSSYACQIALAAGGEVIGSY